MIRSGRGRGIGAALAVLALLLATGCASAPDTSREPPHSATASRDSARAAAEPASAASTAAARPWVVEISAPGALKSLLERHLDLARLPSLAAGIEIGEAELSRLIDATPAQARNLLQTEGHFDPKVTVDAPPSAGTADAPARIRVVVDPGPLTRVRRFDLEVEGDLALAVSRKDPDAVGLLATLRGAWPLKAGGVFRNADWASAKSATLAKLRAAGYASAVFSGTSAQVDAVEHAARLFLVADSGPLFRSGEITVEGLGLHDRRVVDNLARFGPGTVVTENLLLDFQDRLAKSGLFEIATVTLDTDPERAGAARLIVRVKEVQRHELTVGIGVSSNTGPRATLEHFDRRVFGWPVTARNKFEWGSARQAWDGEISTFVKSDGYRWFVGPTIERLKTSTDVVLNQRIRAGRAMEHTRIERTQFAEFDRSARRTNFGRSENDAVTVNQGWVWRDVDNPLLPTDGQAMSGLVGVGQARDSANGSSPLVRAQGRITVYRPFGSGWFGQARIEAGQVFVKDPVTIVDSLGFRAGGDESVRGYAYRSLGPVRDGAVASGKVLFTASAEVARPFVRSMPELLGAVFIDAGNAADRWRDIDPALGYGVGVRYRSPIGPLRLDLAYGHEVRRLRLHFSVGIVF